MQSANSKVLELRAALKIVRQLNEKEGLLIN